MQTSTTPPPAAPDPAGPTGRPRDDAREKAILEAATELLAEVGYDRLTVEGIAGRAHAGKATLYRRWPGKAEIVVDAIRHCVMRPQMIPDLGSLVAEMVAGVRTLCADIGGINGNLLCGLASACRDDPQLASCFRQMIEDVESPLRDVVSRAVERGELAAGTGYRLVDEVLPAVAIVRALQQGPLDEAFVTHLTHDIALPLLRSASPGSTAFVPTATPKTPTPSQRGPTPPDAQESS